MSYDKLIDELLEKWIKATIELASSYNKVTIDSLAVITICLLWFPDLNIIDKAHIAWKNYYNADKGLSKTAKAGLELSVNHTELLFRKYKYSHQQLSDSAYIYLTALVQEILHLVKENPDIINLFPFKILLSNSI